MPTYQYVCTDCGTPLEAVQSFSDPALTECPSCQGKLRKVFSAVGVVFKGSGFYKTDSRSSGKSDSSSSSSDGAKSDSKPAAKSDSGASSGSSSGSSAGSTSDAKPAAAPASKPATASTS